MSSSRGIIWDRPERAARGPAPSLSRDQISTAAVTLADTQGIEAVSMRAVAAELGVGAASLYRYVARKDELIDLMVDAVMGSDLQFEIRGDWREDLRSFAHGLRALTLRHPWMAVPRAGLGNLGPNTARCYEQVLTAIDGLGVEIDEMLVMVETLDAFVRGRALEELSSKRPSGAPVSTRTNGCKPRSPTSRVWCRAAATRSSLASSLTLARLAIPTVSSTGSTWGLSECSMDSPR